MRGTENGSTASELNIRTFQKQLTKKNPKHWSVVSGPRYVASTLHCLPSDILFPVTEYDWSISLSK